MSFCCYIFDNSSAKIRLFLLFAIIIQQNGLFVQRNVKEGGARIQHEEGKTRIQLEEGGKQIGTNEQKSPAKVE
jgi:hypothetical protein